MAAVFDNASEPDQDRRPALALHVDVERAFKAASRHSWLVRALRICLPVLATVSIAIYVLTIHRSYSISIGPGQLKIDRIALASDKLAMDNPRYEGFTKDGGQYRVLAQKARVDLLNKGPVQLEGISGVLQRKEKDGRTSETLLAAKHGNYDRNTNTLELFGGIDVKGVSNLSARAERVVVYVKEQKIVSSTPVAMRMEAGDVRANQMELLAKSKEVLLFDGVSVRLTPRARESDQVAGIGTNGPVDVVSRTLRVDDNKKTAHFENDVQATQGNTRLSANELLVSYDGGGIKREDATANSRQLGQGGRLKTITARGDVRLSAGEDRRARAQSALFDAASDVVILDGGVVLEQQKNMLRGGRLVVDRKQATSRLEPMSGPGGGRVWARFQRPATAGAKTAKAERSSGNADAKAGGFSGMFGTFKSDPNQPIEIEAARLDVDDRARHALFSGGVHARQGDFTIRAADLKAIYTGQAGLGSDTGKERNGKAVGSADLTHVELRRNVVVTSREGHTATAEKGHFDVKANTAVLEGKVVLRQDKNIVEGDRLFIDLTSGKSRIERSGKPASSGTVYTGARPPSLGAVQGACPPGRACLMFYPKDAKGGFGAKKTNRQRAGVAKERPPAASSWAPVTTNPTVRN